MSTSRVCIVTDELHPFTAGGIGRLVHNVIQHGLQREAPVEFHLLLTSNVPAMSSEVEMHFQGKVRVHTCAFRTEDDLEVDAHGVYPPASAFRDSTWHAQSLDLMRRLKELEASGLRFDVIEFPDFHGWAYCALQEKRLGLAFQESEIAVRLHTTHGVLLHFEPHAPDQENLGRFELERKALLDADRVIAHLPTVADFNQRYYGFGPAWREKVVVEFPPVTLRETRERPAQPKRDLLFLTKIQAVKQPELFVRGAALLMRTLPEFRGLAILACHAFDEEYLERVRALVPADLADRFLFLPPGKDREQLMRSSVVVIPSEYESLNLTAYEASEAGARLVLNGRCISFAEQTPFVDGENCYKFDGSVEGLAATLRRALEGGEQPPVSWSAAEPFWERPRAKQARPVSERQPLVSVVITNHNLASYLPAALASVVGSTYPELEVVIVDDASTAPFDAVVLERIEASDSAKDGSVRIVRNPVNRGLAASRNIGVRAARGEYILPLDADDCIAPDFIARAVTALERSPEYDVVVPTAGYFHSEEEMDARQFFAHEVFLGDAPSFALLDNRMSCATALLRRSLFDTYTYNEKLTAYEDWELYLRLTHAGHRFLVTNQVQFFYRKRPGSMVSGIDRQRRFELLAALYAGLPRLHPGTHLAAVHMFALPERGEDGDDAGRALRHSAVDRINGALKRMPVMHAALKQAVAAATHALGGSDSPDMPLRHELVDLLNRRLKQVPLVYPVLKRTVRNVLPSPE